MRSQIQKKTSKFTNNRNNQMKKSVTSQDCNLNIINNLLLLLRCWFCESATFKFRSVQRLLMVSCTKLDSDGFSLRIGKMRLWETAQFLLT